MKRKIVYPVIVTGTILGMGLIVNNSVIHISDAVVNHTHDTFERNDGEFGLRFLQSPLLTKKDRDEIINDAIENAYSDGHFDWDEDYGWDEDYNAAKTLLPIQKPFFEWQVKRKIFDVNHRL